MARRSKTKKPLPWEHPGAEDILPDPPEQGVKRTSLDLPIFLRKQAKVQALEENTGFKAVVIAALTAYINSAKKGGGRHVR